MVQTLRCTLLNLRRRVTAATKIELRVNLSTVYSRNSSQYETDLSVSIRPAFERGCRSKDAAATSNRKIWDFILQTLFEPIGSHIDRVGKLKNTGERWYRKRCFIDLLSSLPLVVYFFWYRHKWIYGSISCGIKKLIESGVWPVWLPRGWFMSRYGKYLLVTFHRYYTVPMPRDFLL